MAHSVFPNFFAFWPSWLTLVLSLFTSPTYQNQPFRYELLRTLHKASQGRDSWCTLLVDYPLRPPLIGWSLARSMPSLQSFFSNVILTSRSYHNSQRTWERWNAFHRNECCPRDQLLDAHYEGRVWSSAQIVLNTAAHMTNLEGRYAFPASFWNIWTCSYASSHL